jgi:hyperosmotically inducible protein
MHLDKSFNLAAPGNAGQKGSPAIDAKAADKKLAKDVRAALYKSGKISTGHVTVVSRSGRVTLIGGVPDERQIAAAGDRARSVNGVVDVDNRLTFSLPGH